MGEDAHEPLVPLRPCRIRFVFASGVASEAPVPGGLLLMLAMLFAYPRVHSGVHYPSGVLAGAVIGVALSPLAVAVIERYRAAAP